MFSNKFILISAVAALCVTACSPKPKIEKILDMQGEYWQRVSSSSSLHTRGPKAQQLLHKDIARCIVELNELAHIEAIREAVPADGIPHSGNPKDPSTPAGQLAHWDTPQRDGDLRHEHVEYHDFETCMRYKGWERISYVPYDVRKRAKDTYYETITGQKRITKSHRNVKTVPVKQDTNELNTNN